MVTTAEALMTLYPNAVPLNDFVVKDDGTGPVIAFWNAAKLGPQPSQATIDAVTDQQVTTAARAKEPLLRDLLDDAAARITQIDTYLAIATPTNAQVVAEVERLSRAQKRLIQAVVRLIQREWRS